MVLGAWGQIDPRNLLASHSSQYRELQVQWVTLTEGNKVKNN